MTNYTRAAAYAASQVLTTQGLSIKRSHLSEIIAALLGYSTHAALSSEEANSALDHHLADAEILVINLPMGEARANQLGLASAVTTVCVQALKSCASPADVYVGLADFYDSHARQALAEAVYGDDDVASVMAESNAAFFGEPEMDMECPPTIDLWTAVDEWQIEARGVMTGEYDPERDRMFTGDTLKCCGHLVFRKAGRAGLILVECNGMAEIDEDWRDLDYDG